MFPDFWCGISDPHFSSIFSHFRSDSPGRNESGSNVDYFVGARSRRDSSRRKLQTGWSYTTRWSYSYPTGWSYTYLTSWSYPNMGRFHKLIYTLHQALTICAKLSRLKASQKLSVERKMALRQTFSLYEIDPRRSHSYSTGLSYTYPTRVSMTCILKPPNEGSILFTFLN